MVNMNQLPPIIQVGDVLLSSEILTEKFCCDLSVCKGKCCVEGDAGAPVTMEEIAAIEDCVDDVWDDLVTSIVGGKDCVFTYYGDIEDWNTHLPIKNCCLCALEKAYRAGRTHFCKPISCALYPIREKLLGGGLTGLNYNRWNVCKMAIAKGIQENLYLYQFLRDPLIRRFGEAWYQELLDTVSELKEQGYL
jgi:hypothetical protein